LTAALEDIRSWRQATESSDMLDNPLSRRPPPRITLLER